MKAGQETYLLIDLKGAPVGWVLSSSPLGRVELCPPPLQPSSGLPLFQTEL